MIPEGTYRARGVDAALGYAGTGTEQVAVEIAILEEGFEAQHMTWYGSFSEKALKFTLKALRTLGWEGDDLSQLEGIDRNEVYIKVEHEEDQEGNLRARVQWINSSAGGLQLKTRMDEGAAKAFAERMKGHVLATKTPAAAVSGTPRTAAASRNGAAPPKTKAKAAAPPDDDNIPF